VLDPSRARVDERSRIATGLRNVMPKDKVKRKPPTSDFMVRCKAAVDAGEYPNIKAAMKGMGKPKPPKPEVQMRMDIDSLLAQVTTLEGRVAALEGSGASA
jgi:hypothetical protein